MNLIEFGCLRYRVLAVCNRREECQVLKYLLKKGKSYTPAKRMLYRLRNHVPKDGPEFSNNRKIGTYQDGIYAFREQPERGPRPRVYFFMDGNDVVVCTEAFLKRDDDVRVFIEKAQAIRANYFDAKARNELTYEKLPR